MLLTIFSYIGVFLFGALIGILMVAILSASHHPHEDEEQLEFLKKYKENK
ncbi:MAG: hypothetical protein J6I85_05085 [Clostridia bacterium]|nr:hypothetical protein [Clostridia bacterium]